MTLTLAGVAALGTLVALRRGSDPDTRRFFDSGELDICGNTWGALGAPMGDSGGTHRWHWGHPKVTPNGDNGGTHG